jgi:hypothetical protein
MLCAVAMQRSAAPCCSVSLTRLVFFSAELWQHRSCWVRISGTTHRWRERREIARDVDGTTTHMRAERHNNKKSLQTRLISELFAFVAVLELAAPCPRFFGIRPSTLSHSTRILWTRMRSVSPSCSLYFPCSAVLWLVLSELVYACRGCNDAQRSHQALPR